jgi:hypothetical protein
MKNLGIAFYLFKLGAKAIATLFDLLILGEPTRRQAFSLH